MLSIHRLEHYSSILDLRKLKKKKMQREENKREKLGGKNKWRKIKR